MTARFVSEIIGLSFIQMSTGITTVIYLSSRSLCSSHEVGGVGSNGRDFESTRNA
jgi:hypothetical protein